MSLRGLFQISECEWATCLCARCVTETEERAKKDTGTCGRDRKSTRDTAVWLPRKTTGRYLELDWESTNDFQLTSGLPEFNIVNWSSCITLETWELRNGKWTCIYIALFRSTDSLNGCLIIFSMPLFLSLCTSVSLYRRHSFTPKQRRLLQTSTVLHTNCCS